MTDAQINEEWTYRYEEKLGLLCGAAKPTKEQEAQARIEADNWLLAYTEKRVRFKLIEPE